MRISDWSSDVCSSDLLGGRGGALRRVGDSRSRCCVNVRAVTLACRIRPENGGCRRLQCRQGRIGDVARMLRRVSLSVFAALAVSLPASALELDRIEVKSGRSEEHTSELQSLMRISYAVFCL